MIPIKIALIIGGLIAFLLSVFITTIVSNYYKKEIDKLYDHIEVLEYEIKQNHKEPPTPKKKSTQKDRNAEVIDTLDWMLQNKLISSTEYNQLMMKSLPYF